jgi:hypothetical protein
MTITYAGPMPHVETRERPTIVVQQDETLPDSALTEILLGIEEEGMPYRIAKAAGTDARQHAHAAATASRLGVGVGVAGGEIAITTEKLPAGRPYLVAKLGLRRAIERIAGGNAARLVKRMPLRDVADVPAGG